MTPFNSTTNRLLPSLFFLWFFGGYLLLGQPNAKPNVLLILVDDLKPAIASFGDPVAITPALDRLAARGMRFELAYSNQAVCMASRYNLMLGSRSTSTGLYYFGAQFREIYPDAVTLPQHFMNHGYAAHSMGKVFHIGHGNTDDAASWSVPHLPDKVIEYLLPESNHGVLTREEGLFRNLGGRDEKGDPRPRGAAWEWPDVPDGAYADGRIAAAAVDRLGWLKENEKKPFFLAVGFVRPHLPFSVPKRYWDMYDRTSLPMPEFVEAPRGAPSYAVKRRGEIMAYKPIPTTEPFPEEVVRQIIHGYYASVTYMDAQLGILLRALEEHGLAENTIVVLWGDHGWHLGDLGSWTKHSNYEQANRIPIIISAPGVTEPGSVSRQLTETVDLYPTLASLAGLPPPQTPQPLDGLDLTPVLRDPDKRVRPYAYHAYPRGRKYLGRAIRTSRYRMVEWTHWETSTVEYELYDYETDHLESVNTAHSHPEVLAKMKQFLQREPPAKAPEAPIRN